MCLLGWGLWSIRFRVENTHQQVSLTLWLFAGLIISFAYQQYKVPLLQGNSLVRWNSAHKLEIGQCMVMNVDWNLEMTVHLLVSLEQVTELVPCWTVRLWWPHHSDISEMILQVISSVFQAYVGVHYSKIGFRHCIKVLFSCT